MSQRAPVLASFAALSPGRAVGLLLVVSILPAVLGWRGDFVWDDPTVVQNNPFLALPLGVFLQEVFRRDFGIDVCGEPLNYYRPVILLSLKANWMMAGAESPAAYRATNALIHALNALLVYGCLRRLPAADAGADAKASPAPLAAGLVFAAAGWNAEAISFISARGDSMNLMFVLAAAFLWLEEVRSGRTSLVRRALVSLSLLCCLLSKETALPLLAALPFLIALFAPAARLRHGISAAVVVWSALAVYLAIRAAAGIPFPSGLLGRALATDWTTEFRVLGRYLLHLAWPSRLLAIEPAVLSEVNYGAAVLVLAAFGAAAWAVVVAVAFRARPRLAGFCFVAAALLLLPLLLLHGNDPGYALSERFLYFPATALAVCAGVAFERAAALKSRTAGILAAAGLVLFIVVQMGLQARKNLIWSEEVRFWAYHDSSGVGLLAAPLQYGLALLKAGEVAPAEAQLSRVEARSPHPSERMKAREALDRISSGR